MAAHWPADRQCAGSVADLDAFAQLYASSEASGAGSAQGSAQGSGQASDQARPVRHGPASLPISRILDWVKDGRPAWHTLDPHRHAPLRIVALRLLSSAALRRAYSTAMVEAEAAPQELPLRALPACPAYDDDLYAASAARAAVAKAVHAYGKAHAGRLREAFELVGALWLHDAAATHVERPTVASAWARELRRAARDDAVGSWLAARSRDEVRTAGDGVRAAFLHLARHDVSAAAKACAAAGRTRAALCLAARDAPDADPAMRVEFARARAVAASSGDAAAALEARVLGVAAGAFDLEDDVELSNPHSAAGLRWRTRLGLHAWYGRGDTFEDALGAFDAAVCDGRARAPLADEGGGRVPAAHYTLLKLAFSRDVADADALLTSFAHGLRCGEAPGGRWHLALCLRALGVEVAQASLTRLGAAFVEDLCGRGLWHWALLVIAATHDDAEIRERLARDVLERHAWPPDGTETPGAQLRPGAVEEQKRLELLGRTIMKFKS